MAVDRTFLNEISDMLEQLTSALDSYVQDDEVAAAKSAFKDLVKQGEALKERVDDVIHKLAMADLHLPKK